MQILQDRPHRPARCAPVRLLRVPVPTKLVVLGTAALLALTTPALAHDHDVQRLVVGDAVPRLSLEDQHGEAASLPGEGRKLILFMADMDAGDFAHAALERAGQAALEEKGAALVADIHRMPGIISAMIAKPRMRDYSYRLILIEEEGPGAVFPRKPGQITVLELEEGRIESIGYLKNADELRKLLEIPAPSEE